MHSDTTIIIANAQAVSPPHPFPDVPSTATAGLAVAQLLHEYWFQLVVPSTSTAGGAARVPAVVRAAGCGRPRAAAAAGLHLLRGPTARVTGLASWRARPGPGPLASARAERSVIDSVTLL